MCPVPGVRAPTLLRLRHEEHRAFRVLSRRFRWTALGAARCSLETSLIFVQIVPSARSASQFDQFRRRRTPQLALLHGRDARQVPAMVGCRMADGYARNAIAVVYHRPRAEVTASSHEGIPVRFTRCATETRHTRMTILLGLHEMAKLLESRVTKAKRRAGQIIGYLRVSSLGQKELRQLEGMTLDKRFVDKASVKNLHRPQLEQLTGYVREGDTVICHAMNRLARNLDDLRKMVLWFWKKGNSCLLGKENLTSTLEDSPTSHLLLSVMGAFAQI